MTPESRLERLDATVPIAFFPVRIETRFTDDATALRVRVYPDVVHVETHETELSGAEAEGGRLYWRERWAARGDGLRTTTAWNELTRTYGARRALWIVERSTPVNVADLGVAPAPEFPAVATKEAAWTRPATARLLPDRWAVIGIRDGAEVVAKSGEPLPDRVTVGPDPAAPDEPSAPEGVLALDEALRWLTDYEAAESLGMAVTIRDDEVLGGLAAGLDQLIVLGVRSSLTPGESAAAVAEVLGGHLYTDGLSIVLPGSPTNNTEDARTGPADPAEASARALDPAQERAAPPPAAARELEAALGLVPDSVDLARVVAGGPDQGRTTALLIDALWSSTLGYYLEQLLDPLADDATVDRLRSFAASFLRPGGPLPVLRIGRQPYGVLPVVASARYRSSTEDRDGIEAEIHSVLKRLRGFWEGAVERLTRLGRTGDPDSEFLHLLQMVPLSAAARLRRVIGPELEPNTRGLEKHALAQQYYAALLTRLALASPASPRVASFTADPRAFPLRVPWVQEGDVDGDPLQPNYLARVARLAREDTGRALLDQRDGTGTLLDALATAATLNELDRTAARVVAGHQRSIGAIADEPARVAFRAPEAVRIPGPTPAPTRPGLPGSVRVDTPRELSALVLPTVTGDAEVGAWIARRLRDPDAEPPASVRPLIDFLESLDALAERPTDQLDRALRGVLDCYSHRLDAWLTSLATARLAAQRARSPDGVHIGGYGWVEDLAPDATADSLGYVHAPSLEHASAAAILRSGHLAHRDPEHQAMNIDLRSERVRLALGLLEGVAQGQPLASLLGYRLERGLRDRDPRLARFVAPLRRLAPLRPGSAPEPGAEPAEEIAARDVVDGLALLERWRSDEEAVLDALDVAGSERAGVRAEIDRVADALDAVSDLMVAESVYQTTAGSPERARAAMAVLDRQERPVDVQVVRTPRTGFTYLQRLLVLLQEVRPPAGWRRQVDPRARAEPRLNAWIARILGDPKRFRFTGRILTDGEDPRPVEVGLRDLGLSPLALVTTARRSGTDEPSELEQTIALRFASDLRPDDRNPRLEIDGGSPEPDEVGLEPLLVLLEWIGALAARRPANARDTARAEDDVEPGFDVAEIAGRADTLAGDFDGALAGLEAAVASRRPSERRLRRALEAASAVGARDAIPRAIVAGAAGNDETPATEDVVLDSLLTLGRDVLERMRATGAALEGLQASEPAGEAATPGALVEHHSTRIRLLLGDDFPVLPAFSPADPAGLTASSREQAALSGGDPLAATSWLQRMALVRPEADALQRVLTAAGLLGGSVGPEDSRIAQLPHRPGQRWMAMPPPCGETHSADLALVAHAPGEIDFTAPVAALLCDEWTETIPAAEEVTGLTFHYDAPGARTPNSVLVGVAADPAAEVWSFDELVDVVREAADLAKIRLVGPRELHSLGTLLPTTYLPENFAKDVPSIDMGKLTKRSDTGPAILGRTS